MEDSAISEIFVAVTFHIEKFKAWKRGDFYYN